MSKLCPSPSSIDQARAWLYGGLDPKPGAKQIEISKWESLLADAGTSRVTNWANFMPRAEQSVTSWESASDI